jgi:hypothetical protein
MMNWQKWVGAAACILLIAACFMPWTYYPDLQKHFTGFDTKVLFRGQMRHYYGRPGNLLVPLAVLCLLFHLVPKLWAKWTNLVLAALCAAYALSRYLMFTSGYNGLQPQQEIGLWLVLLSAATNLGMAVVARV